MLKRPTSIGDPSGIDPGKTRHSFSGDLECVTGKVEKMRRTGFIVMMAFWVISSPLVFTSLGDHQVTDTIEGSGDMPFQGLPDDLHFIQNRGQLTREDILFYTREPITVGLCSDSVVHVLSNEGRCSCSFEVELQGCNEVEPVGLAPLETVYNFLVGEEDRWRTHVPAYSKVLYENIWDGIDMEYYSTGDGLKYDLIVHPGADPGQIRFRYVGIEDIYIDKDCNLILETPLGKVMDKGLMSCQGSERIDTWFRIEDGSTVGIELGGYDEEDILVIDPLVLHSTFLEGSRVDELEGGIDTFNGYIYASGKTRSTDFPLTPGALDSTFSNDEGFITKLKSDLSGLEFSTFIGGSEYEEISCMTFDGNGDIYIGGVTESKDYPTTPGALNETSNIWTDPRTSDPYDDITHSDAFISKLDPDATGFIFSTFLGGHGGESVKDIEVGPSGNVYLSGYVRSSDFPVKDPIKDHLTGDSDYFLLKLSSAGSDIIYSTYFGFDNAIWKMECDEITDIEVDDLGRLIFCGCTDDPEFPIMEGAYNSIGGWNNGYLAMLYPNGSALEFCTYLESDMSPQDLEIGSYQDIYVAGISTKDTLTVSESAPDKTFVGQWEGFLLIMDFNGTDIKFATYLGGTYVDRVKDLFVVDNIYVWICGETKSYDFPLTDDAYKDELEGNSEGFITCFSASGGSIFFSTYFGGDDKDSIFNVIPLNVNEFYVAGETESTDFPLTDDAFDNEDNSTSSNIFISRVKINSRMPSAPVSVILDEGDGFINISWSRPYDTGNEEILNYRILRSTDDIDYQELSINDGETLYLNDTGLTNGEPYFYKISALNIVGEGPYFGPVKGIPGKVPDPPANIEIQRGGHFLNISWEEPYNNGGREVLAYAIYYGEDPGDLDRIQVDHTTFWYNLTGLTNGVTYHLVMSSLNEFGEGPVFDVFTPVPMGIPSSPLIVRTTVGGDFCLIEWDEPEDDGGAPSLSYNIYSADESLEFDLLASDLEVLSYNLTPFEKGTFMAFKITALNEMGESDLSDPGFSYELGYPSPPIDPVVETDSRSAVLTWSNPESFGGTSRVEFNVYMGQIPIELVLIEENLEDLRLEVTGLENGITYYFAVSAVNINGEGPRSKMVGGTPYGIPSAPVNLICYRGDGNVTLFWGAPDDWGGYTNLLNLIYAGTDPSSLTEVSQYSGTSITIEDLENGRIYYFKVRAQNPTGSGPFSNLVSAVPLGLPGIPENVLLDPGDASINISWEPSADTGGSEVVSYEVMVAPAQGGSDLVLMDDTKNHLIVTGLINGLEYVVQVRAINEVGPGPYTEGMTIIPYGLPSAPSSFIPFLENGKVNLNWTAPLEGGGTGYIAIRIYRGTAANEMAVLVELPPGVFAYIDDDVIKGKAYFYEVRYVTDLGEGAPSQLVRVEITGDDDTPGNGIGTAQVVIGAIIMLLLVILIIVSLIRSRRGRDGDISGEGSQRVPETAGKGTYPGDMEM